MNQQQTQSNHHIQGMGKKTLGAYVTGLVLSLLLTLLAFATVAWHWFSSSATYVLLALLAVVQLIVQVTYFLRLNSSRDGQWNLLPFICTIIIVAVLIGGSLWIMYNLNYNMVH